ncbi:tetratricopeptide repeat protein [Mannheimia sp. USDA-ARS-USMARC-1261]|uniref:tetratricopeptide repeat protein n=1 Tax=Mannheimia sp. USDA-ARS-USMARC-1261 TaxID=1432056 RepID=UPI000688CFCB|nr:SEL1-like repeat protein [Mannheimia sp. USDA-ARS-USMARC-1261]
MYGLGKGVELNSKQSVYWLEKSAEQGVLGIGYEYGSRVVQNLSKAKYYYGLACDGGNQKGCENYAELDKQGVK